MMFVATLAPPGPALAQGTACFTSPSPAQVSVGAGPSSVAVGDFNNDGKLDFANANFFSNSVSIRLGNGDGTFTPASTPDVSIGTGPRSVALGDFNHDGKL